MMLVWFDEVVEFNVGIVVLKDGGSEKETRSGEGSGYLSSPSSRALW